MTEGTQARNAEGELLCPNCGGAEDRGAYRTFTGIEIRGIYDGPIIWECFSCKHRWPRFNPPGRLYDYAVLMLAKEK